jgi:hypothetical protein
MNFKKIILYFVTTLVVTFSFAAWSAEHCPEIENINRIAGENRWVSHYANWEGQFIGPEVGRGYSKRVVRFETASWVALNNLPDSPGYVTCDYAGNFETEVIRFTQKDSHGTLRPLNPEFWDCYDTISYPSVQCTCTRSEELCKFG